MQDCLPSPPGLLFLAHMALQTPLSRSSLPDKSSLWTSVEFPSYTDAGKLLGAGQTKGFRPLLDVFTPSIYRIFRASQNTNRWRIINQMFAKSLPLDARVKKYRLVALFSLVWTGPQRQEECPGFFGFLCVIVTYRNVTQVRRQVWNEAVVVMATPYQ